MAQYPSIRLIIDTSLPDWMIVDKANSLMRNADMSELERRAVIKELALAVDKVAAAKKIFDTETI